MGGRDRHRAKYFGGGGGRRKGAAVAFGEYSLKNVCTALLTLKGQEREMVFCLNPILHTWFRDSCFTCDCWFINHTVLPLLFNIGMVI